jgi:hypothetical protein
MKASPENINFPESTEMPYASLISSVATIPFASFPEVIAILACEIATSPFAGKILLAQPLHIRSTSKLPVVSNLVITLIFLPASNKIAKQTPAYKFTLEQYHLKESLPAPSVRI